jgi:hypothetical protein
MILTSDRWPTVVRPAVTVAGLDDCLHLFGLARVGFDRFSRAVDGRLPRVLARTSRILGDPRLRMVDLFLSLQRILPDRYPSPASCSRDVQDEHRLWRVLDYAVIGARVQVLYVYAASELDEPRLLDFIRDGFPIYAWPYEDRHVWTTTNPTRLAGVLARAVKVRATHRPRRSSDGDGDPACHRPQRSTGRGTPPRRSRTPR